MNALRLLRELNCEELDYPRLEKLIKCDVSLSYKLFKYVNSALFARRKQISSVHDALMTLGELNARRWITLATLPSLTDGTSSELTAHALVRARFCEAVAEAAGLHSTAQVFTIGLFSLLDALMNRPLPEILSELNLARNIEEPLLGVVKQENASAVVYLAAKAYEEGNWDELLRISGDLHLPTEVMAECYLGAIRWSTEMLEIAGIPAVRNPASGVLSGRVPLLALGRAVNPGGAEARSLEDSGTKPVRMY
jgi:EAL and modified HD-GYP domain-containing signal transduction protein